MLIHLSKLINKIFIIFLISAIPFEVFSEEKNTSFIKTGVLMVYWVLLIELHCKEAIKFIKKFVQVATQ